MWCYSQGSSCKCNFHMSIIAPVTLYFVCSVQHWMNILANPLMRYRELFLFWNFMRQLLHRYYCSLYLTILFMNKHGFAWTDSINFSFGFYLDPKDPVMDINLIKYNNNGINYQQSTLGLQSNWLHGWFTSCDYLVRSVKL